MKALLLLAMAILLGIIAGLAYAGPGDFVLFYTFDDASNMAKDLSGKGNNGKITDAKSTNAGKFGGAIEFNGKTSVIEVPHSASLAFGGQKISIMAWLKTANFPSGHPPIARKGVSLPTPKSSWGLDTPAGKARGFVYTVETASPFIAEGKTVMDKDKWYHVAMVFDGKEIKVYLNGVIDISVAAVGNILPTETPIWIGKKGTEEIYMNGVMDDLGIMTAVLNEVEIKAYMEKGLQSASVVSALEKLTTSWGEIKVNR